MHFPEDYCPFLVGTPFPAPTRTQKTPVPVLLPLYSRGTLPRSGAISLKLHLRDIQCQRTSRTRESADAGTEARSLFLAKGRS